MPYTTTSSFSSSAFSASSYTLELDHNDGLNYDEVLALYHSLIEDTFDEIAKEAGSTATLHLSLGEVYYDITDGTIGDIDFLEMVKEASHTAYTVLWVTLGF